jgi:hypothetical protein
MPIPELSPPRDDISEILEMAVPFRRENLPVFSIIVSHGYAAVRPINHVMH